MGQLYRILHDLGPFRDGSVLIAGSTDELLRSSTNAIGILLDKGIIAIAYTPPLEIIPGWEKRALKLKEAGIETVGDLVTANIAEVAEKLNVPAEGIEEAADEAKGWISIKEELA